MKRIAIYLYCTLFLLNASGCNTYNDIDNSYDASSSVVSTTSEDSEQTDATTSQISETSALLDPSITSSDSNATASSDGATANVSGSGSRQEQTIPSSSDASSSEQLSVSTSQSQIDPGTSISQSISESQSEQIVYFDKAVLYDSSGLTAGTAAVTQTSVWSEDVKAFIDSLPFEGLRILDEPQSNTLKKSTFAASDGAILLLDTRFRYCMYLNTELACLEFYDNSDELNIEEVIYMQSTPELYSAILDNFEIYSK